MEYSEFLKNKVIKNEDSGFEIEDSDIHSMLFDFQKAIVKWALKKGRCAIFADTGLGKTLMQLEWARMVHQRTNKPILILAPLAVSTQTKREGEKISVHVNVCRKQEDVINGINITNYEMLEHFIAKEFVGIVLDESSILKSFSGKIRSYIIEVFKRTEYKLACTATPAPNDYVELGNHSEFLNVMSRVEMLSTYFVHDGGETQQWRLKGHAQDEYWKWLCTWAIALKKPSDIGNYDDQKYDLPALKIIEHIVEVEKNEENDMLFDVEARGLKDTREARKESLNNRIEKCLEIIQEIGNESILVWCDYNNESDILTKKIKNSVEIAGAHSREHKEISIIDFVDGKIKTLITKPSIAGHGMNFQICHNVIFIGIGYSYEQYYQAIRRCWRYGQTSEVNVHIILGEKERDVLRILRDKEELNNQMSIRMIKYMKEYDSIKKVNTEYKTEKVQRDNWTYYLGDNIELIRMIPNEHIGYSIFSPPFVDLYTYNDSVRDMGNSKGYDEFFRHFGFLVPEIFRVLQNGRLVSVHCIDIPSMKERDGVIGLKDFPGDIIKLFVSNGFIYHSRHTIWKDPLIEATRTKSLGLMHKQIMKDSSMCRAGLPDYLLTFRKPGENQNYISHPDGFLLFIGENEPTQTGIEYSHNVWRRYASPIWMDVDQSNTLQRDSAREEKDEKHICPLQLDVIARGIELWSNQNDIVLDPFGGIGSTGFQALKMGRRAILIELKESYYRQGIKNLAAADVIKNQQELFNEQA